jgi:hypothetical protein
MRSRAFNILAAVSLALCVATGALWVTSYSGTGGGLRRIVVSRDVRIHIDHGRISVDNLADEFCFMNPRTREVYWRGIGISYACIEDMVLGTLWDLTIPMVYPFAMAVILPAISLVCWLRRRRDRMKGCCRNCGYDLRGNPSGKACPECGTPIPVDLVRQPLA